VKSFGEILIIAGLAMVGLSAYIFAFISINPDFKYSDLVVNSIAGLLVAGLGYYIYREHKNDP
jgi:hypothetical protein